MFPIPSISLKTNFEKTTSNFTLTNKNLVKVNPNFNLDILKINENDIIGNSLQDFLVLSQLGRGSNGTIYKVRSKLNNKEYVLKKINLKNLNTAQQKEAFKEAKILKKVKHPNIIRYFQSFRDDGSLYIIMEYAEGGDLQKLIRTYQEKKNFFSEQEIWRFAKELSSAILYLHSHKIIHRDIKTLNIFLTHDYKIKLGDLGFSKIVSNMDALQANRVGTPMYLSPEMIKLKPYDYKVDVWALGCVLYHVSCLEPPFSGENLMILGYNIINKTPKNLPPIYPEKLNKFIMWLLVKNPLNRPKICELVQNLNGIINSNNDNLPNFIRQPGNMQAMTLFKNLKVTNTLHKNEKNEKVQLLFKPEINEFKKYYELNKQLESQDKQTKNFSKPQEIKRFLEPSALFLNGYDPAINKLRTQTSQAQFRYKEKPTGQTSSENKKEQYFFDIDVSSILQNKEKSNNIILEGDAIFQYEKEDLNNKKIFPKEEEKLVLVGENFKKNIEDVNFEATKNILRIENFNKTTENKQTKKYLQKKTKNLIFERETTENIMKLAPETDDLFIKTNQIDSPIHKTIPKELLRSSSQKFYKTKSIATILEKSEVNIFQKFRKNKLIKDENSVKSSSNIGDKHPYQIIMELNQTRNLAENFYKMDDGFEKDKRAMTAFDGKRDAIFSNFNNREQEMMEKGVICNFLQQGNFQNFPNFSEHRPNTTGCDSKLRRKFTIKDLE